MTDYKITPPPELVEQWYRDSPEDDEQCYIADQAARWGADQELEACCEWLQEIGPSEIWLCGDDLRQARRPKPPSLSKPALAVLDDASDRLDAAHENTIRRALERLQELEGND